MNYQVLARKYRPQNFDDVIGQKHITELLKKAINAQRVAHAYLFCGPRGIGKTTCARIMAMCMNCEGGPRTDPPADDPLCRDIIKGNSLDVIEIDGASNRGIDEVRALRENVKFAPSYGRYKIYIVDEVHMLTTEAFNALLKTLEEPPEHVKFIFATTEPHKVPPTIISRCQRFDFKRIAIPETIDALKDVAKKEKLKVDDDALFAIAKAAQGSLRDALSVLDQMSALSERDINAGDVYSMLGLVEAQLLFELADSIAAKDCNAALGQLEEILDKGKDVKQLTKDLTEHFRHLMVIKVGGKALGKLVDYPVANKEMLLTQSKTMSLRNILQGIDTLIMAQDMARITETQRMPLELALAKLTYQEDMPAETAPAPKRSSKKEAPREEVLENNKGEATVEREKETSSGEQKAASIDLKKINRLWDKLTHTLSKEKMSVATFLQDANPVGVHENVILIGFPKANRFQKENLESKENILLVERVFSDVLKLAVRVKYDIVDDFKPKDEESSVRSVLDTFGGQVINRWHNE